MRTFLIVLFIALVALAITRLNFFAKKEEQSTLTNAPKATLNTDWKKSYDRIDSLWAGYWRVHKNDKMGLVNAEGTVVTPCIYDKISYFYNGYAKAQKGSVWGFVNKSGVELDSFIYEDLKYWKEDIWWAKYKGNWGEIETKPDDKNDLVLAFAQALDPFRFRHNSVTIIGAESAIVYDLGLASLYRNSSQAGTLYKNILPEITGGYLIVTDLFNKQGLIDLKGWEVLPPTYDEILPFVNGFARVRQGKKWGYIDAYGKEKIAPQYDKAADFSDEMAAVSLGKKQGYIDNNNRWVLENPRTNQPFCNGRALFKEKNLWGYINTQNEIQIPAQYVNAQSFSENFAWVQSPEDVKNGIWTSIYTDNKERLYLSDGIIPQPFSQGFALIQNLSTQSYYYIYSSTRLLPGDYTAAESFLPNERAKVTTAAGTFYINTKGKMISIPE